MKKYFLILFLFTTVPLCGMKEEGFSHQATFKNLLTYSPDVLNIIYPYACRADIESPLKDLSKITKGVETAPFVFATPMGWSAEWDGKRYHQVITYQKSVGSFKRERSAAWDLELNPKGIFYLDGMQIALGRVQTLPFSDEKIEMGRLPDRWMYGINAGSLLDMRLDGSKNLDVGIVLNANGLSVFKGSTSAEARLETKIASEKWKNGNLRALLLSNKHLYCFGINNKQGSVLVAHIHKPFLGFGKHEIIEHGEFAISQGPVPLIQGVSLTGKQFVTMTKSADEKISATYVAWPLLTEKNKLSPVQKAFILTALAGVKHGRKWEMPPMWPLKSEFTDEQRTQIRSIPPLCIDYLKAVGAI